MPKLTLTASKRPKKLKLREWIASEEQEQEIIMHPVTGWAVLNQRRFPELRLLHASMNGILTNPHFGAKLKRLGRRSGVPDLSLPVPRWTLDGKMLYAGLYIELKKRKGGEVSASQEKWIADLREQKYRVEVCRGAQEAIAVITEYLEG